MLVVPWMEVLNAFPSCRCLSEDCFSWIHLLTVYCCAACWRVRGREEVQRSVWAEHPRYIYRLVKHELLPFVFSNIRQFGHPCIACCNMQPMMMPAPCWSSDGPITHNTANGRHMRGSSITCIYIYLLLAITLCAPFSLHVPGLRQFNPTKKSLFFVKARKIT